MSDRATRPYFSAPKGWLLPLISDERLIRSDLAVCLAMVENSIRADRIGRVLGDMYYKWYMNWRVGEKLKCNGASHYVACIGVDELAECIGKSSRTVKRSLKRLAAYGYISVIHSAAQHCKPLYLIAPDLPGVTDSAPRGDKPDAVSCGFNLPINNRNNTTYKVNSLDTSGAVCPKCGERGALCVIPKTSIVVCKKCDMAFDAKWVESDRSSNEGYTGENAPGENDAPGLGVR